MPKCPEGPAAQASGALSLRPRRRAPVDGRRRQWLDPVDLLGFAEEAEDSTLVRSRGARRAQSSPAFLVQPLPDRLKGRPLAPSRRGEGETDPGELLLAA